MVVMMLATMTRLRYFPYKLGRKQFNGREHDRDISIGGGTRVPAAIEMDQVLMQALKVAQQTLGPGIPSLFTG